jgi:predicted permease
VLNDLRFAFRKLRQAPGFAGSAVLILALGIGANTGAFSALRTLLLKPLPYPNPSRLVSLYETTFDGKPRGVAMGNLLDWRVRSALFESMAVYQPRSFGLTFGERDAVIVIQTGMVMADIFRVLGVAPAMGRTFGESEEITEAKFMVLTDRMWRRLFPSDRGVLGRRIFLNEEPYTIIGVMPPGFEFPMRGISPDAFIPLSRRDYCCGRIGSQDAVARLKPGATVASGRAELAALADRVAIENPATNLGRTAGLVPLVETLTGNRREPLFLLTGCAALLLAIACTNVAGLLLARCLRDSREIAIRASLGAGTGQIARMFLAEAVVLTVAGALGGIAAAEVVLRLVPRLVPTGTETTLSLDGAAFVFGLAVAAIAAVALSAVPTWMMRSGNLAVKGRDRYRGRAGGVLAATQVALSVVLLLSAGLLLRNLVRLAAVDPGFATTRGLRFGIGVPEKRYDTDRKLIDFHRALLERLAEIPGVERVGAAVRPPLRGGTAGVGGPFQIAGSNIPIPQRPRAWINAASPGYFAAMGIPLLEGREFSYEADRPDGQRVAIVNQTFVRTYLSGRRATGTLLDTQGPVSEIVGVVADTRQADLDAAPVPEIFRSLSQGGTDGAAYVVRYRGNGAGLAQAVSRAVAEFDPRVQRVSVQPLALVVERSLESRWFTARLAAGFGLIALGLMAAGLYGIVAFRAAERSREMAIRAALGATESEIRRIVLGHGAKLSAIGALAGVAAFLPFAPPDPLVLGGVLVLVLIVGTAACVAPSRRAARSAPMDLLREG